MIKKEEVYKIGLFNKPHGIHGELQFTFTDDIFDRVDCDYLVCLLDGIFVPFFMEEYRFRSDSTALVKLEGVDTAERARMFTNVEVYFPVKHAEEAGEGELSWEFFVGFRMEDVHHGMLGEVVDVDTATVNTLFIVEREGEELLVPAGRIYPGDRPATETHHSGTSRRFVEFGRTGGGRISNQNKVKVLKRNRL